MGLVLPTAAGALLWIWLVAGRTRPLAPEETSVHGLGLFVPGLLAVHLLPALAMLVIGGDPDEVSLSGRLALQVASNLAGVGLVLLLAARLAEGLPALGLRRHRGPNPLVMALSTWLVTLPLLALAKLANEGLLEALGLPVVPQDHLSRFLAEGSLNPFWVWTAIVLILPLCEELLFRGALYGGLRRRLPAPLAMLASGLLFGLLHDASVILPVAVLGTVLAWLYERSGSLLAPYLVHVLQNGITLTVLTLLPEELP